MDVKNDRLFSCPLCNSNNTYQKFKKDGISYFNCKTCDFLFSKPSVNENFQESINDFEDAYIEYFDTNDTDKRNFDLILNWLKKEFNFNGKSILDVGCGSGKFVNHLRKNGINAKGIEYSRPLYEKYLKDKEYFYTFSLEEFNEKIGGVFDVVTLFDVLEHIDFPGKFIQEISKLQTLNGYLIKEIPLHGTLHSRLLGKKWHFFNKYHLSYFRKKRLVKLLDELGYNLIQDRYRGKYFHFSYLLKYFYFSFFKKNNLNIPEFLEKAYIYINTYDIYIACFQKKYV